MKTDTRAIKVWDIPTRIFHWLLAASFVIALATAESERLADIHYLAGYAMAGLIGFRLIWGFVGSRHARFADFWPSPKKLLTYLASLTTGKPQNYIGHNPAGAIAIFLLLGFGLVAAISGWTTQEGIGGHFMEELHEGAGNGMMVIVAVHLVGVVVSSWLHRENLVKSMITGWKKPHTTPNETTVG